MSYVVTIILIIFRSSYTSALFFCVEEGTRNYVLIRSHLAVPFEFSDERPTQLTLGDGQPDGCCHGSSGGAGAGAAAGGVGAPAGPRERPGQTNILEQ